MIAIKSIMRSGCSGNGRNEGVFGPLRVKEPEKENPPNWRDELTPGEFDRLGKQQVTRLDEIELKTAELLREDKPDWARINELGDEFEATIKPILDPPPSCPYTPPVKKK